MRALVIGIAVLGGIAFSALAADFVNLGDQEAASSGQSTIVIARGSANGGDD